MKTAPAWMDPPPVPTPPSPRSGPRRCPRRAARRGAGAALLLLTILVARPVIPQAANAETEGQALAAQLRAQRPATNLTTSGVLKLRDSRGKWRRTVPVALRVVLGEGTWQTTYQAFTTNQVLMETLVVTRGVDQPNQYQYSRASAQSGAPAPLRTLSREEVNLPFAGSDFWAGDLALDFAHWPGQRLVKTQMRKGRSCRVLESTDPAPSPGGYARVLSWIDLETGGLLRAEAYGSDGALLKEFSVGSFKKINKVWQLKSMDIRNDRTDTRTRLEFELELEE